MSNQQPRFQMSSTFRSASYSYSSASINGNTTSRTEATYSDPSGTKIYRKSQNPGEAPREERIEYDRTGRSRLQDAGAGAAGAIEDRIEDVTEEQTEAERQRERDRLYEQRMEEEYAKKEGGA